MRPRCSGRSRQGPMWMSAARASMAMRWPTLHAKKPSGLESGVLDAT